MRFDDAEPALAPREIGHSEPTPRRRTRRNTRGDTRRASLPTPRTHARNIISSIQATRRASLPAPPTVGVPAATATLPAHDICRSADFPEITKWVWPRLDDPANAVVVRRAREEGLVGRATRVGPGQYLSNNHTILRSERGYWCDCMAFRFTTGSDGSQKADKHIAAVMLGGAA